MNDKTRLYRLLGVFTFLSAFIALGAVWGLQIFARMMPCELCVLERIPYYLLVPTGLVSTVCASNRIARFAALFCASILWIAEVFLSALHWGVEAGWWQSPFPSCRGVGVNLDDPFSALPLTPAKPCDAPDYLLDVPLSVSHAGSLYALASVVIFCVLWRMAVKSRG